MGEKKTKKFFFIIFLVARNKADLIPPGGCSHFSKSIFWDALVLCLPSRCLLSQGNRKVHKDSYLQVINRCKQSQAYLGYHRPAWLIALIDHSPDAWCCYCTQHRWDSTCLTPDLPAAWTTLLWNEPFSIITSPHGSQGKRSVPKQIAKALTPSWVTSLSPHFQDSPFIYLFSLSEFLAKRIMIFEVNRIHANSGSSNSINPRCLKWLLWASYEPIHSILPSFQVPFPLTQMIK